MEENKNNILQVMGFDKVQLPQFKEYINKQKEVEKLVVKNVFIKANAVNAIIGIVMYPNSKTQFIEHGSEIEQTNECIPLKTM